MGNFSPYYIINLMYAFFSFRFGLPSTKLVSVEHCLLGKQHPDTVYFSRNLKIACRTSWYSHTKISKSFDAIFISYFENQTPSPHTGVWSGYLISSQMTSYLTWRPAVPGGDTADLD